MGLRNTRFIQTWEAAQRAFEEQKPVRGKNWRQNWRPLLSGRTARRYHWAHIEDNDTHYSVVLYDTTLAKYYPPGPDRYERVELYLPRRYATQSTQTVLANLGAYSYMRADFRVPLATSVERDGLSAVIYLNADTGHICPVCTHHLQLFKIKSSDADKAKRVEFIKQVDAAMLVARLFFDEFNAKYDAYIRGVGEKGTFGSADLSKHFGQMPWRAYSDATLRDFLKDVVAGTDTSPSQTTAFHALCEVQYRKLLLASEDARFENGAPRYSWSPLSVTEPLPRKPVAFGEYRSGLRAYMLRVVGMDKGTQRVYSNKGELPKRPYYTTGVFPEGVDPRGTPQAPSGSGQQAEEGDAAAAAAEVREGDSAENHGA